MKTESWHEALERVVRGIWPEASDRDVASIIEAGVDRAYHHETSVESAVAAETMIRKQRGERV